MKVRDLAYGRLRAPDLDAQEEFLTNFGMVRAARTPTALYMRGTDPAHHLHVTEKGDTAQILKNVGGASIIDIEDEKALYRSLPDFFASARAGRLPLPELKKITKFDRKYQAHTLAGILSQSFPKIS